MKLIRILASIAVGMAIWFGGLYLFGDKLIVGFWVAIVWKYFDRIIDPR